MVLPIPANAMPEIGCDVALFGDDWTAIHIRAGGVSLYHDTFNNRDTTHTSGRLQQLATEWAGKALDWTKKAVNPKSISIKVDDDGVGGGVVDSLRAAGFTVVPVNASSKARKESDYPKRRDELWFTVAERAKRGELSLVKLPEPVRQRLRQQALAPEYWLDDKGRRAVEPKDRTKAKIGRSPDDMDALNLAYAEGYKYEVPTGIDTPRRDRMPFMGTQREDRGATRREWGLGNHH